MESAPFHALPPKLLKHAAKCTVRECDETEHGTFVAFVDDGDASYDVMLSLDSEGRQVEASCDCGGGQPCAHVVALMQHVMRGAKHSPAKPVPKARARKAEPWEAPLEEADARNLKLWLRSVLPSNKELALAFIHHFTARTKTFSPEEAAAITRNAVKTVLGRKQTADATQIKKLLELWKTLHVPIVERYTSGPADEAAFLPLQAALDEALNVQRSMSGAGKVTTYVQRVLTGFVPLIATLVQEEAFDTAADFFISNIYSHHVRIHYVQFLSGLSEACNAERSKALAERIARVYRALQGRHGNIGHAPLAEMVMNIMERGGVLAQHLDMFQPIRWANEYNVGLIEALIAAEKLELAEQYAWAQVNANRNSDYDDQYLELLKEIYIGNGNEEGRTKLAIELLPRTFDIDDYVLVWSRLKDEEARKALRQKMFTRARHMAKQNSVAAEFSIRLLAYEHAWEKIVKLIADESTPYKLVLEYFGELVAAEKLPLLKALLQRSDKPVWGFMSQEPRDLPIVTRLAEAVVEAYEIEALAIILQKEKRGLRYGAQPGRFIEELEKLLQGRNRLNSLF